MTVVEINHYVGRSPLICAHLLVGIQAWQYRFAVRSRMHGEMLTTR
jgi:hypothetical protein